MPEMFTQRPVLARRPRAVHYATLAPGPRLWDLEYKRQSLQERSGNKRLDPIPQIRLFGKLKLKKCARAKREVPGFFVSARKSACFFVVINKLTSLAGAAAFWPFGWPRRELCGSAATLDRFVASGLYFQ